MPNFFEKSTIQRSKQPESCGRAAEWNRASTVTVPSAVLRFYAELNDFLAPARKSSELVHEFGVRSSVKDIIESLGVPHTKVELILVNGQPALFTHIVQGGDRVAVYPAFRSIETPPEQRLRFPVPEHRFVADVHLGRMAAYLRMLGFDTIYARDAGDANLARIASSETRILLTRDRGGDVAWSAA